MRFSAPENCPRVAESAPRSRPSKATSEEVRLAFEVVREQTIKDGMLATGRLWLARLVTRCRNRFRSSLLFNFGQL
jgi:hypothetical protein